jgi:multidrug efflux pump
VTDYRPDDADDEVDVMVRFPEDKRDMKTLDSLRVMTANGAVPVTNFLERKAAHTLGQIKRVDGIRVMTVEADVTPGLLPDNKLNELAAWIKENGGVDPQVRVSFKGDKEDQQEAGNFLKNAFGFALFMMALVLVIQFNSIYQMVIILSAVFLSTVGVLIGLLITQQPFGIVMCGVGIISLAGIVVNNNIIFIDTYNVMRGRGLDIKEALIRTGVQRLRPILLTAGTTVLGLIPMVIAMNIDFISREVNFGAPSTQWWRQLSTSIAGGLAFATVLTLFFTPALLVLGERFENKKASSVLGRLKEMVFKKSKT